MEITGQPRVKMVFVRAHIDIGDARCLKTKLFGPYFDIDSNLRKLLLREFSALV